VANKHLPYYFSITKGNIKKELQRLFAESTDPYVKAECLRSLAFDVRNYNLLFEMAAESSVPVVKTAGMEALKKLTDHHEFNLIYGRNQIVQSQIAEHIKNEIVKADPGVTTIAASVLQNELFLKGGFYSDFSFLKSTMQKLSLPRDIEAYNEIEKTLALFEGKELDSPTRPPYNHPVNWAKLRIINTNTKAAIQTDKGSIVLRFFPENAPATYLNFIQLAEDGFYEGKVFHRVVPNFVIQGGCPRGDGFGSQNYTIRSELSSMYYDKEGLVGMASAGNHTESTQWFITHSPTPHLDGRYTIFAEVVEGMQNVHAIEIGDRIKKIRLFNE